MGLKTMLSTKAAKIFKPIAATAGKVMSKVDANKPEIMLWAGAASVIVGTVWMLTSVRKTDEIVAESQEKKDILEEKKPEMTEKEYKAELMKIRWETILQFGKLFGIPAMMYILGFCEMVGGHLVLKKRYLITATTAKGLQEMLQFVKQNVIADAGEEKWEEYSKGVIRKEQVEHEETEADGTVVKKTKDIPVCRPHDNPWRIEYSEELFNSWKPNTESNIFFLQTAEKYWDEHKYQYNKDAEISIYEVLDYLGIDWSKIDKNYRTWLRNQVWGHHIYGDDKISFGLNMADNEPARRRLSDKLYMEFNTDGEPKDIINRYRDPEAKKLLKNIGGKR